MGCHRPCKGRDIPESMLMHAVGCCNIHHERLSQGVPRQAPQPAAEAAAEAAAEQEQKEAGEGNEGLPLQRNALPRLKRCQETTTSSSI